MARRFIKDFDFAVGGKKVHTHVAFKTGHEAVQYLHVLLALCMGYETRQEYM